MELVGIVIAVFAALFVFFHAWLRHVPTWAALLWSFGTLMLLIPIFPLYLIVRPKGPDPHEASGRLS